MYFIDHIQTYKAVNRKGDELQKYILRFEHCLIKDSRTLGEVKENIRRRMEELDARYPRTLPMSFHPEGNQWNIHVKGRPDSPVCILSVTPVKGLLGKGSVSFPGNPNIENVKV
ncbi:hypothetical protein [Phocaeicola coprocola]|mgnify:FL=1|jgi:hypothetical protein|uniref:hypothetical protein n=1 Tax=Phocaeicola coprocola TaxID=310298 RepID=UPI0022E600E3|nr:hypothetical protein [Phocaeicola coprocola]